LIKRIPVVLLGPEVKITSICRANLSWQIPSFIQLCWAFDLNTFAAVFEYGRGERKKTKIGYRSAEL
jgi:hypothetical protein